MVTMLVLVPARIEHSSSGPVRAPNCTGRVLRLRDFTRKNSGNHTYATRPASRVLIVHYRVTWLYRFARSARFKLRIRANCDNYANVI